MSYEVAYTAIEEYGIKNQKEFKLKNPLPTNETLQKLTKQRMWIKDENGGLKLDWKEIPDVEKHAVNFIRNRCQNLRFKKFEPYAGLNDNEGTSLYPNQIPYNVNMDIDRRCLEMAIHRFMESGISKDAFDVYFIFLEMFIGKYEKTRTMIEMLSEFETNASSLLIKHRDHYVHSVYVFVMGLAYFDSSENYRKEYKEKYIKDIEKEFSDIDDNSVAAHFLKYWGLTSLFHDIGYPFEVTFDQVKSYFGNTTNNVPFVTYNMNNYLNSRADDLVPKLKNENSKMLLELEKGSISADKVAKYRAEIENNNKKIAELKAEKAKAVNKLNLLRGESRDEDSNINAFLVDALIKTLGGDYVDSPMYKSYLKKQDYKSSATYGAYLFNVLSKRNDPESCGGFIDHAYYSAMMLTVNLIKVLNDEDIYPMYSDAVSAILLHNSFYKFAVTNYKQNGEGGYNRGHHFTLSQSPLAFLLMLCDEIQCWDRTSYGKDSRGEIHPVNCNLTFRGDVIRAEYVFDAKYADENGNLKEEYKGIKGTYKKIIEGEFLSDIESIVSINGDKSFENDAAKTVLEVSQIFEHDNRYRRAYLSNSNFIHLYKFCYLVHQMNHPEFPAEEMEKKFSELSLEYQMSHIGRTKKYSKYLDEIDCFYSDKPLDFERVLRLEDDINDDEVLAELESELDIIGALEHDRWCFDHYIMGWKYGKEYVDLPDSGTVREKLRVHKDMFDIAGGYDKKAAIEHYKSGLKEEDRKKDKRAMNNLLKILDREDGVKVYRLGRK